MSYSIEEANELADIANALIDSMDDAFSCAAYDKLEGWSHQLLDIAEGMTKLVEEEQAYYAEIKRLTEARRQLESLATDKAN